MKFCCPKCGNEFTIDNLRFERVDNKGEECYDILFECDYCDEETAFVRIHPGDLISLSN